MSDNLAHFLSGAGGGVISIALTYPLQNISTALQIEESKKKKSTLEACQQIFNAHGIKGFFSGWDSALVGVAFTQGVFYLFFEKIKEIMLQNSKSKSLTVNQSLLVSSVSGFITAIVSNPIWVINTKMIKKTGEKQTTMQTTRKIFREDGISGFFKGLAPAIILVINPIIQYFISERLGSILSKYTKTTRFNDIQLFAIGLISKFFATTITFPIITIKSNLQKGGQFSLKELSQLIEREGPSGLYKGYEPKIIQSILTSAILFVAKERLFRITVTILILLNLREKKSIKS